MNYLELEQIIEEANKKINPEWIKACTIDIYCGREFIQKNYKYKVSFYIGKDHYYGKSKTILEDAFKDAFLDKERREFQQQFKKTVTKKQSTGLFGAFE